MSTDAAAPVSAPGGATLHASCVLVGRRAVLIRGPAGSGKSSLVLELLGTDGPRLPVRLVADDAVILRASHGRLVAFAPAPTRGLLEIRGLGIVRVQSESRAVVGLVVDLVASRKPERMPESADSSTEIMGLSLPRLALPIGASAASRRIAMALEAVGRDGGLPVLHESMAP